MGVCPHHLPKQFDQASLGDGNAESLIQPEALAAQENQSKDGTGSYHSHQCKSLAAEQGLPGAGCQPGEESGWQGEAPPEPLLYRRGDFDKTHITYPPFVPPPRWRPRSACAGRGGVGGGVGLITML